jgi:hypothetical protein
MLYKTNCWGVKVQKSFIKTKNQFIELCFFGIFQHSYKSFNKKILDQDDIKVALHKYV